MPQVNVPGVGTLQFPDGMSQDEMSAAIQKNYPQIHGPQTQAPSDSPFLKGIKDFGNEAGRVALKTATGPVNMAADFGTGLQNLASRLTGGKGDNPYPSDATNQAIDSLMAPPTNAAGKWSEGLSGLIASLGLPGPKVPQAVKQSLTGADAVKAEAMGAARDNGVVIPPTLTKAPPTGINLVNGWGGGAETLKKARDINTPQIDGIIAKDIGLDHGSSLTSNTINDQINEAVKAGHGPLRDLGSIPYDQAHLDFVNKLGAADRGASNISPVLGNPQIAELAKALAPKTGPSNSLMNAPAAVTGAQDSADILDAISALRAKATDAYASGNNTLGAAFKRAASGYESLIDRFLQSKGADSSDLLDKFRLARTRIAKGHDALSALNKQTGDIDPRVYAGIADSAPDKLTGGAAVAAKIGGAFPDAVIPAKGTPSAITAFQANAGEAASNPYGFAASIIGRPIGRNIALSKWAQRSLMQPKGKTLSQKALDGVFANPVAFANLYEDQAQ
jgi:hypothetical protein